MSWVSIFLIFFGPVETSGVHGDCRGKKTTPFIKVYRLPTLNNNMTKHKAKWTAGAGERTATLLGTRSSQVDIVSVLTSAFSFSVHVVSNLSLFIC